MLGVLYFEGGLWMYVGKGSFTSSPMCSVLVPIVDYDILSPV